MKLYDSFQHDGFDHDSVLIYEREITDKNFDVSITAMGWPRILPRIKKMNISRDYGPTQLWPSYRIIMRLFV